MRKIIPVFLLVSLSFVTAPALANFILGNASKYNLHFNCGDYHIDVPAGAKPVTLPYNPKQKKYPIAFSYYSPTTGSTDSQPVFKDMIFGRLVCSSSDVKSCIGSINLRKKAFAEFIEVYSQNKAGDMSIVFDDLPTPKIKQYK